MNFSVDFKNQFGEVLLDEDRKISKAHLDSVCLIHQKKKTCKYISLNVNGYTCVKKSKLKDFLDKLALEGKLTAQGDNCEGLGEYDKK